MTWHTQDPSGLVYARARYLDPKTGRFLSPDPIVSANSYRYALNNPLTWWDPYGLTAATEEGTVTTLRSSSTSVLKEVGEDIACTLLTDAAAVAAGAGVALVVDMGCAVIGSRPGGKPGGPGGPGRPGGPKPPDLPEPPCPIGNSFTGDTAVSVVGGPVEIAEVEAADRVFASVEREEAPAMWQPLAASCEAAPVLPERRVEDGEVLAYDVRSGWWSLARESDLPDVWLADGHLTRWEVDGVVDLGPATLGELQAADAVYDAERPWRAPCLESWVLALDADGGARHARLVDVRPGEEVAYRGRVLETQGGASVLAVRGTPVVLSRVKGTSSRVTEAVIEAEVRYADGAVVMLRATRAHPFFLPEAGKFVSLGRLDVGETVRTRDGGDAVVVTKREVRGDVEVFNFEVQGEHNYFVGDAGRALLTHNAGGKSCGPKRSWPDEIWCTIKDNWFRGPEWGKWKDGGAWQRGYHFHFDPFPGSNSMMGHHLPQQRSRWWKHFKSHIGKVCKGKKLK